MSLRQLPTIQNFDPVSGLTSQAPESAFARWHAGVRAAAEDEAGEISILDVIGEDWWTGGGVTSKRVAAALRAIGDRPVTVNVNSPGGDVFEGIAIYNLLREHKQQVTVRVLGLAASAASVIAMAGDRIEISVAGFIMVHNAWVLAAGNRHELREVADWLEPFDQALVDVYAARTGLDAKALGELLDAETWMNGSQAVEKGFADGLLAKDAVVEDEAASQQARSLASVRRVDAALGRQGLPRTERRRLIQDLKTGTPGAAAPATHDAGLADVVAEMRRLAETLKS